MSSVVIAGDTSGTVSLTAPLVAGSVVVTLPGTSGTIALTSGATAFTNLTVTNDASISGLTVGKGGGAVVGNTAVGLQALNGSNTGTGYNVAVGYLSLFANTSGQENIGVGVYALGQNTTGSSNVAIGRQALQANTTASNNTAVGYQAGYSNTTGTYNTALGYQAGYANTTNSFSTYIGQGAGLAATGAGNTFIGSGSGYLITTGGKNSILGQYNGNQGGLDIRTASNYIVLSDGDGNPRQVIDGNGLVLINKVVANGTSRLQVNAVSGAAAAIETYHTATTTQNHLQFNNGSVVGSISTNGSLTSYNVSSDYRLKEDITPMTGALNTISALKPCTYKWKIDGSNGQGFIAHELAEIAPECVTGEKDAVNEDGSIKPQGIDTSFLVATLVSAIQELNAKLEAQALEIAALKGAK